MDKQINYTPNPIDISEIELPKELSTLIEQMAKNVHEVWAENRFKQGWRYGKERDDILKTHPCLIPYEQLPEDEKDYDRNTAISTLKLICKLGYRILDN